MYYNFEITLNLNNYSKFMIFKWYYKKIDNNFIIAYVLKEFYWCHNIRVFWSFTTHNIGLFVNFDVPCVAIDLLSLFFGDRDQ